MANETYYDYGGERFAHEYVVDLHYREDDCNPILSFCTQDPVEARAYLASLLKARTASREMVHMYLWKWSMDEETPRELVAAYRAADTRASERPTRIGMPAWTRPGYVTPDYEPVYIPSPSGTLAQS